MKEHFVSLKYAVAASLSVAGIGAGCAGSGGDVPGSAEETGESAAAVITPPSRVGPYRVGALNDGTPVIVDGGGYPVVHHGVTRPGLESSWHGEGPSTASLLVPVPDPNVPGGTVLKPGIHPDEYLHMKQWGFDTVRLAVSWNYRCYGYRLSDGLSSNPDANLPCNNPAVWEAYWQIIKDNVRKIQAQGMDVIIDVRSDASVREDGIKESEWNHMPHVWFAEDGTAPSVSYGWGQGGGGLGTFLRRLGYELGYKPGTQPNDGIDRSRVIFEIFQEPHRACLNTADWSDDELWKVWLDGTKKPDGTYGTKLCTLPKADGSGTVTKSFTYAGMRVLYDRVRDSGAQNVVLVPGLDGIDLRRVAQPAYQITGATNLAYSVTPQFWFARDNGAAGIEKSTEFEALFDEYFGNLAIQSRLFPVVIGEVSSGEPTGCSNDQEVDFLHMVLLYATRPNRQFGWAAWSWFYADTQALRCGYYSSLIDGWRSASGGAPGPSILGRGVQEFLKATRYVWPEVTDYASASTCDTEKEGSLYWALKYALPGQWVRFKNRDALNNVFLNVCCTNSPPPMKWGVRMTGNYPYAQGVCSSGITTLDGCGFTPSGLTLEGNNDMTAMNVQAFTGVEIDQRPPYQSENQFWCTTTSP